MFGRKTKEIKRLTRSLEEINKWGEKNNHLYWEESKKYDAAKIQVTNLTAQLSYSEESVQVLNEENRDLQIRLELLQSVLKQLNIPVKLKK